MWKISAKEEEKLRNFLDIRGKRILFYHRDSISSDAELLVSENDALRRVDIGNFYEEMKKKYPEIIREDRKCVIPPKNIKVFSVMNGKVKLSKVKSLVKHKVKKRMFEVIGKSGKIKVTEDHSLMTFKHGKFVPKKPEEIEYIASPLNYNFGNSNISINLLDYPEIFDNLILDYDNSKRHIRLKHLNSNELSMLKARINFCRIRGKRFCPKITMDEFFMCFFGLWLADGAKWKGKKGEYISISAWNDIECRKAIKYVAEKFGCKTTVVDGGVSAEISSTVLFRLLKLLEFEGNASTKRVPSWVFNLKENLMAKLLQGYFSGDGTVSKGDINVNSVSERLLRDTQTLLLFFGIRSCIRKDRHCYKLSINNAESKKLFLNKIGFLQKRKSEKVKIAKKLHSIDMIPLEIEIKKKIKKRRHSKYINFSREYLRKLLPFQNGKIRKILKNSISLNVLWEKAKIRDLGIREQTVYDIETESGNFVAENIVVKNTDGICSAALWLRFFPDFECFPREGPRMDRRFVKWVVDQDPDLLVFLDLPVDQEWKRIEKMLDSLLDVRILLIDHHIVEHDLNSGRVLHINPKFKEDVYLPAAFLVYRILEQLGEYVEELDWIAALGIVGDYGFEDCRDFLDVVGVKNLDKGAELVSAAITLKGLKGADIVLKLLLASDSYREFLQTKTLGLWKKYVDKEFSKVVSGFEKEREEHKDANLVIYIIKSRLNFTSVVATHFSEKLPDKIILIGKKGRDMWKLSVRNQSGKFNVGDLVKRCVKGIGSGGGHKKAAGGVVKDFEKFKRRLISELQSA